MVPILERIQTRTERDGAGSTKYIIGVVSLTFITVLWGSSFPVIKIVVTHVNSFCYIFYRNLIAITILTPYIIYLALFKRPDNLRELARTGLITGIVYTLALWLQGWGTEYTSATCSAFITGLNVVFVHLYAALYEKRYSKYLLAELILAVLGLYLITRPQEGTLVGNLIVLASSILWAVQVILISRYAPTDPVTFAYFELLPSLIYAVPTAVTGQLVIESSNIILGLAYLAITCTVIAFTLQAYGQRYVKPEVAAIIYLLEPVAAAAFSYIMLGEMLDIYQIIGATMIMTSIITATVKNI
ncbi:MAG: DMT family transporter [Crenarchaeota archaeon]|nr:DMT family transporter [Thermoproteota archaeon]